MTMQLELDHEGYPIHLFDHEGELIDRCGNVETAVSILYGDLSCHEGEARVVVAPAGEMADRLRWEAEINADCWGIPMDKVEAT